MSSAIVLRLHNRLLESSLFQILNAHAFSIHTYQSDLLPHLRDDALLITDHLPGHGPERTILIVASLPNKSLPFNEAFGLVSQYSDVHEIILCLQAIKLGGRYISPFLVQERLGVDEPTQDALPSPNQLAQLSRREREVFTLLRKGNTLKEVANALFISRHTAERHRASIQSKLKLKGRNCLVRFVATYAA